ncbi:hypothetical protein [Raineyella fluvialis]|uniref:hypothetical protein n=1 Tax=Raineyella fluvialis TaxID=2662261 RepID=UPI001E413E2C|nr:hypothetical protein [Raineyella fluvialis]
MGHDRLGACSSQSEVARTYGVSRDWVSLDPLRRDGALYRSGIGKTYALALVHDLDVTVIDATTGEILRELTIDPTRDYQPTGQTTSNTHKTKNA